VRYYSPPILLAVVANNPHEAVARQAFMQHYGDPYQGLVAFATELAATLRESRPFRLPEPSRSQRAVVDEVDSGPEFEQNSQLLNV
jgi:hypothetical protein